MKNKRHNKILDILFENENISIDELANQTKVSTMTIRRDLDYLQQQNMLTRTHGGARVNKVVLKEISYQKKSKENLEAKRLIAQAAIKLIEPNSSIFLDAGTTVYELARLLVDTNGHTIITNDINIAQLLCNSQNDIYMLGGLLESETGCAMGVYTIELLKRFNIDIAFVATNSITDRLEIGTSEEDKGNIKEYVIGLDAKKVLLVDESKFHRKSLFKIASIKEFTFVISDYVFNKKTADTIKNVQIINV